VSAAPPPVARIGELIADRYRLDGVLGEGGMGAVFSATQTNLDRQVAVKLLHTEVGANAEARQRFEREAKVSAALHHPHAVKIFDFGEDSGRLFLVMEKLRGTSLRSFVDKDLPPLSPARTLGIARQTADVLRAAHAMGLVHRDLKPENIFMEVATDGSDRVVVVDFGLAFIAEKDGATDNRMTQDGAIMGTPIYMPPEQCSGQRVGPPADIYAFGCMLYEMVVGEPPFDGENTMQLLTRHLFEAPVPPRRRRTDLYIPTGLERLILAMLAKQADQRPTAEGVAQAIAQLEYTLGERERARGVEFLEGREARMIRTVQRPASGEDVAAQARDAMAAAHTVALQSPPEDRALVSAEGQRVMALHGELDPNLSLGLQANGYLPMTWNGGPLPEGAVVAFFPEADLTTLANAVKQSPVPLLTDAPAADMDRVAAALAVGVAEVVPTPLRIEDLARRIERVLKKAKRRRKRR
jgi:predicted Ser/Thr protein kinase